MKKIKLDSEELEILKSFENEEFVSLNNLSAKKKIKEAVLK